MADFAPVQESELETGPQPPAGVVGNGQGDLGGFQPVNDNDLAPGSVGGPAGPTGEFAYKGIPAAAARRFSQSNPLANILGTAVTKFSDNFVNNFTSLNDADMKILVENGYGDYSGPGALLQHAADAFNSGATLLKNGIMAGISSIAPTAGAVAGQTVKEAGGSQTEADRAEREFNFDTMAALSDVGSQHGMAMEGAAKAASPEAAAAAAAKAAADEAKQVATAQAQAAAPGIWGHAYRVDGTPDGDLVQTPLGRLPSAAEAASQAQTVADALHLPPETADVIHKTYVQTGRPPAEVLMDAQTNHGGVLSDLVAGKVPTAYEGPARAMTPDELGAAKGASEPEPASQPVIGQSENQPVGPEAGTATIPERNPDVPQTSPEGSEQGVSRIGQSIEQKAIDAGITDGFLQTAGYDVKTIKGQTALVSDLITNSPDKMNAIVNGEEPIPHGMDPSMFITGVEEYIKQTKDWDLASRLANSPVVTKTSEAGQTLRFAQERTPDSATAQLAEIQKAKEKQAGGPKQIAARRAAVKEALPEASKVLLPKEQLSWDKFLSEIAC